VHASPVSILLSNHDQDELISQDPWGFRFLAEAGVDRLYIECMYNTKMYTSSIPMDDIMQYILTHCTIIQTTSFLDSFSI